MLLEMLHTADDDPPRDMWAHELRVSLSGLSRSCIENLSSRHILATAATARTSH